MSKESNYNLKKFYNNNLFFKDYGKKIIALIIAIMLWFATNLEFDIEKKLYIPVKYTNLPQGLIITNNLPDEININIKGPRYEIFSFDNSSSVISYDLSDFKTGVSNIQFQPENMNLPRKIKVTSVSPSEISIEIDRLSTKNIAVIPLLGRPDKGYLVEGEPKFSPTRVKIKGPRNLIRKYKTVYTSLISLKGEKTNFSIEAPIELPNNLISIESSNLVKVTVNIKEDTLKKEFKDLDISFKNFDKLDYTTSDKIKAILVFDGTYSLVNKLNSEDISVYIDAGDLKKPNKGEHELTVKVDYPNSNSLNLTKITPEKVKVKINSIGK